MTVRQNIILDTRHVSEMAGEKFDPLPFKPISADSHICEPPNTYKDYIDPKFRDRAPYVQSNQAGGEVFVVPDYNDGKPYLVTLGGMAAAGLDPKDIKFDTQKFSDIHKGGHEPKARIADQDRDGIAAEVIFPTVGMVMCNHPDAEYKQACMTAYNRWLQEFCGAVPDRLFGLGQSSTISVEQTIKDFQKAKDMGFVGVMMPGEPATEFEYDDPRYDPVWEASVALNLPISFHILTSRREGKIVADMRANKGRSMAFMHHTLIRSVQDVISTFLWGRVFERFPKLKLICAEADAGWVPHFTYRLDHFYRRHRFHAKTLDMSVMPSQRISENVYFTFQDDLIAFNSLDMMNPRKLLWANDFPHSDSTWPWSQQLLAHQTKNLSDEERRWVLRDNTIEAFNLPIK
jgi:predicted TIM-barrel fold metal-dependent hydrolase